MSYHLKVGWIWPQKWRDQECVISRSGSRIDAFFDLIRYSIWYWPPYETDQFSDNFWCCIVLYINQYRYQIFWFHTGLHIDIEDLRRFEANRTFLADITSLYYGVLWGQDRLGPRCLSPLNVHTNIDLLECRPMISVIVSIESHVCDGISLSLDLSLYEILHFYVFI